ncbi:PaaI family thioesterase [Acholeplasma sp. OttesenSCG-928-E16]|nr:PaaI family thioesterase [Acholeplasma sp. OttesenSCG-928-E16]
MINYKVIRKQNNADMCIVCGTDNPFSLKANFYDVEGYFVVGIVNAKNIHQSYPGRMHGGIITSLLDEAIGRAVQSFDPSLWAVTIELTTKYIKPVPLNSNLYVVGKLDTNPKRIFSGTGYISDEEGNILARATGKYMMMTVKQITGSDHLDHKQWKYIEDHEELKEISLPE